MLWCIVIFFSGHAALFGISHVLFTGKLVWLRIAPPLLILYLQFVTGIVMQRLYSRFKNRLITDLFGKYVSPSVVNDLLQGEMGVSLEGQSQVVTVLFSDLRSFTTLSENLSPRETGILLNTYFDAMIPVVFNHRGTLDKLIGDAIMCFFGAPARLEDHPSMAALTALVMMDELESLKREKDVHGVENLNVGIGLNSGEAIVGNLGSNEFMDYTVIGDTVNLASRLEGLNKVYGTGIIVSQATAEGLDEGFFLRAVSYTHLRAHET